jgi:hypothetical protein
VVFFLDDRQQQIVDEALAMAARNAEEKTKAARNAAALAHIAESFVANGQEYSRSS